MKVRCIQVADGFGRSATTSPWVKLGGLYTVLQILVAPRRTQFRLCGEEPRPALFPQEMFSLQSGVIPDGWNITARGDLLVVGPASWAVPDYWERYFNDEATAVRLFEEARSIAMRADE